MSETATMLDLEDGEIEDSDTSLDKELDDNVIDSAARTVEELEQRMLSAQPRPSVDRKYRSTHNPCLDSSDDSSSNEDDDLDLESPIKAKSRRTSQPSHFQGAAENMDSGMSHGNAFLQAASDFQKDRSNSVWKKVVYEQTLNETILKVNTDEVADTNQDRGVESYNFMNKRSVLSYDDDCFGGDDLYSGEPETADNNGVEMADDGDKVVDEQPEVDIDIGDVESFGTTQKPNRKRTIKDRLGKKGESQKSETDSRSNSPTEERQNVKSRLGNKNFRGPPRELVHNATFDLQSKEDDPPEKVATDLVRVLGEPEYQTELFMRVVTTLGVKKSLELYYDTESIEAGGGMLIMNGFRRRSPGGVFLQLIKQDKEITKDDASKIFIQNNFHKKFRKNKKKTRKDKKEKADKMEVPSEAFPLKTDAFLREMAASSGGKIMETPMENPAEKPTDIMDDDLENSGNDFELICPDVTEVMT